MTTSNWNTDTTMRSNKQVSFLDNPTSTGDYGNDLEGMSFPQDRDTGMIASLGIYDRHRFIQKVYCNLTVMCVLTGLSCYAFLKNQSLKDFAQSREGNILTWICFVILLCTIFAVVCCDRIAKVFPYDYIILTIFTICQSYILGAACIQYSQKAIIMAGSATVAITLALTLFAFQTKIDCTGAGGFLCSALTGLIVIQIINIFVKSSQMQMVTASIGVLLFSAYLVYDTQLVVGGTHHKYQFGIDEHVFATINLYLDIVNLFIYLLQLFGSGDD